MREDRIKWQRCTECNELPDKYNLLPSVCEHCGCDTVWEEWWVVPEYFEGREQ